MDTPNNKFFIYARKSTDDTSRQIRSIEDQVAELRDHAIRKKLCIVEKLEEKRTAKGPGRPIFNDMLDRIEKGEADGILAWHPNRLARNPIDAGRIMWLIDTGKIRDVQFPSVQFENTAAGKFMLGMMFTESKHYVDNLSETIKRGQRRKVKDGIWPQMTPLGYLNDRAVRIIVPDPVRAPLVRNRRLHTRSTDHCRKRDGVDDQSLEEAPVKAGVSKPTPSVIAKSDLHRGLPLHRRDV